jgi:hypothetical protein
MFNRDPSGTGIPLVVQCVQQLQDGVAEKGETEHGKSASDEGSARCKDRAIHPDGGSEAQASDDCNRDGEENTKREGEEVVGASTLAFHAHKS